MNAKLTNLGQDYSDSVHNAHTLLSDRSTALEVRCHKITTDMITLYKHQSRQTSKLEEYTSLLNSAIPIITTSLQDLLLSINELGDAMKELESDKAGLIEAKNAKLLQDYSNLKQTQFQQREATLVRESSLLEKWVKEKREKAAIKAFEDHKRREKEEYEAKLKEAFLQANAVPPVTITTTLTSPIISKNALTIGEPSAISSEKTNSTQPTPVKQTQASSILAALETPQTNTNAGTSSTNNDCSEKAIHVSNSTPGVGPLPSSTANTASAIDLLEKYANGVPDFDDDFIQ